VKAVDNQRVLAACLSENALRMKSSVTDNVPELIREVKRPSALSERQGELDTTS